MSSHIEATREGLTKANIDSLDPYYVTKEGLVYNHKYELLKGTYSPKQNIHILSYRRSDNKVIKIPFTRLIYTTFYPGIDVKDCFITRVKVGIANQYNLYNLHKVHQEDSPKNNGLLTEENKKNLLRGPKPKVKPVSIKVIPTPNLSGMLGYQVNLTPAGTFKPEQL